VDPGGSGDGRRPWASSSAWSRSIELGAAGDTRRDRRLRPWESLLSAARASFGAAMGKGIDGRRLWASLLAFGGALSLGAAGDAPSSNCSCRKRKKILFKKKEEDKVEFD